MTIENSLWEFETPEALSRELTEPGEKPAAVTNDSLPFSSLGGRRFELLAYLLVRPTYPDATVRLGKSTGDGGRDVAVYADGEVRVIIQCKNLQVPLDRTQLIHELLKIALHSYLDPSLLGSSVTYEIWATSGLKDKAFDLITSWPSGWTEANVRKVFGKVVKKYVKLKALTWEQCSRYVLSDFPARLTPKAVDGHALVPRIRQNTVLFDQFFKVSLAVSLEDVAKLLGLTDFGLLIDALKEFPAEQRLAMGGLFFGLTPFHFRLMSTEEQRQIIMSSGAAIQACTAVLINSVSRHIGKTLRGRLEPLGLTPATGYALTSVLIKRISYKASAMLGVMDVGPAKHAGALLRDDFERQCGLVWEEFEPAFAKYDPQIHDHNSDEHKRVRIAMILRGTAMTKKSFVEGTMADFRKAEAALRQIDEEMLALIPRRLFVVSNSAPFDPKFFDALVKDAERLREHIEAREAEERAEEGSEDGS